jgi:hypothetical protein
MILRLMCIASAASPFWEFRHCLML